MATHLLFVYGTLKEGFRNFAVMRGKRRPGSFVTVQPYPMYVLGAFGLPWLVDEAGRGHAVLGHVFETDDAVLAEMDAFERVGEPQWYTRRELEVRHVESGATLRARVETDGDAAELLRRAEADSTVSNSVRQGFPVIVVRKEAVSG